MRFTFFFITFFSILLYYGQGDSTILDRNFKFRNGIYTTNFELIQNAPKYPDYFLEEKVSIGILVGMPSFYYFKDPNDKKDYHDSIFAYVLNGELLIKYRSYFYEPILIGPITTFISIDIVDQINKYSKACNKLFFVDLLSGKIDKLYPENIEATIQRDKELFSTFSSLSYRKLNRTLYSYVLRYNSRNPIFIKQN